ncbi:hypothetical protein [Streptomyces anulatus]|uniref:hypothetical protein n=1 Tax=Streptomyces anulatus TaxID=1892 RepID=UPI00386DCEC2|nr:hypothetical protein OG238_40895 [Streptomyces anulatus]
MTTIDSTPTPDPTTPGPDPVPVPVPVVPVFAPWAVLLLAVGMFVLTPVALVLFMLDRPNVRESMDAAGSFIGGTAGLGALILSLVMCVLQARDRPSP